MDQMLDKYDENLAVAVNELQICQTQKDTSSCLTCEKVLQCDIRDSYVKAVYESMSKGSEGGFEF